MGLSISTKMYKSKPPVKYSNISAEPDKERKVFQGSPFASRIKGTSNEWELNTNFDIVFNHVFENDGWPYVVYGSFSHMQHLRLKIQFLNSLVTGFITVPQFMSNPQHILRVQDPYMPVMFNGNGALGNIDYEELGTGEYSYMKNGNMMYAAWCEILGRCYDPTHPYYPYFGHYGVKPRYVNWHVFRHFYKEFDTYYHEWEYYPNPNDYTLYIFPMCISQQATYRMTHLHSPVEQHSPAYSYMPFDKRAEAFNSATPKKRGPKRLMYRLKK